MTLFPTHPNNRNEEVILVDVNDEPIGTMEKMEAHEKGLLHRAFSVFIFNDFGELLLQRRANSKYHSGGLWTNTCCSHQRPGETNIQAASRRLQEEMGFETDLTPKFTFLYKCDMGNGLTEHEFDHVLFGVYNNIPDPNPSEVSAWKFLSLEAIDKELLNKPHMYTEWFKICFFQVLDHFNQTFSKAVG
jgi:isopentenyl-diphosphate delta-isomerase